MLHGECKDCGRNAWLRDDWLCPKCVKMELPELSNSDVDPLIRVNKKSEELIKQLNNN